MIGQKSDRITSTTLQRRLRKEMTDADRTLWQILRGRQLSGVKFRRQHRFGDFILDFVSLEIRLVIEADGSQHQERCAEDAQRTAALERAGFAVLRFWNHDILQDRAAVAERIYLAVCERLNPSPSPPPP